MNGAQQLITQLQQGAPFQAVARQFSGGPTAANGGDAGWLAEAQLPPEVRDGIEQMHPGQLSQPIPVKDGVYIVYWCATSVPAPAPTMVSLKQAAIALAADAPADQVAAARQKLLAALKLQITSCDNLEAKAGKVDGVVAGDLGEADINDLRPQFQRRGARPSARRGQRPDPHRGGPAPDRGLRQAPGRPTVALARRRRGAAARPAIVDDRQALHARSAQFGDHRPDRGEARRRPSRAQPGRSCRDRS